MRDMARQLAQQPYKAPDSTLPAPFKDLDYQAYRAIRFDPSKALWHDQRPQIHRRILPPRLYLYKDRVDDLRGG